MNIKYMYRNFFTNWCTIG